jgi:2-amino-4-hydroxy-6-hydroxymethyldihydropteridine diphosphokinase
VRKTVYLSLGSNLGARAANLETAITRLSELGTVKAVSSFYESEPIGSLTQPWFINCAVALETERMPRQFLSAVLRLERDMGRRRTAVHGPRSIDIDILLFGNALVDTAELTIPHPALHERRFVLEPMVEIAPEVRHPALKKTMRELRDALPAGQKLRRITPH